MKTIEMKTWRPEVTNTHEENDMLVKGIVVELQNEGDGAQTVLIGGDTLVFGAIDDDGRMCVYECAIRRSNCDASELNDETATMIVPDGKMLQ